MKDEYDFSGAEQGKFYRPVEQLQIPVYLDKEIQEQLCVIAKKTKTSLNDLVNRLLKNDLEIAHTLEVK